MRIVVQEVLLPSTGRLAGYSNGTLSLRAAATHPQHRREKVLETHTPPIPERRHRGTCVNSNQSQDGEKELVHVHQCSACKRFVLPDQFSARDNVRGLYECPFCHSTEALNVQIVSRAELEDQSGSL